MTHSIYRIDCGGQVYYGYTSRDPKERIKEHEDTARGQKWKHNSALYPLLVEMEFEYEWELVKEFETELEALLAEIVLIANTPKGLSLNLSKGGEGSTIMVKLRTDRSGKREFKVVARKQRKKKPTKPRQRRRRRYRR